MSTWQRYAAEAYIFTNIAALECAALFGIFDILCIELCSISILNRTLISFKTWELSKLDLTSLGRISQKASQLFLVYFDGFVIFCFILQIEVVHHGLLLRGP